MAERATSGRVADRPRWMRTGSVFVRAAHLLAAAVVAGAVILGIEDSRLRAWWIAAAASGVLLLAFEYARHRELHREVAGWATILKVVLIGLIAALPVAAPWLMSAAVVVAGLGAHLSKDSRHRKLF